MSLKRLSGGSLKKLNADQKQSCRTLLSSGQRRDDYTDGRGEIGQEANQIERATLFDAM